MKQVLFLDIDEVINNRRTTFLFGYGSDIRNKDDLKRFDHIGLAIIRRIVEHVKADVVISSSWRIGEDSPKDFADGLQLPVIDFTPSVSGCRGNEIDKWLQDHVEYENYVILDDMPKRCFLKKQYKNIVHTSGMDGFLWQNAVNMARIFGFDIYDIYYRGDQGWN